ncbi:ribbon-helix-helix protein, CopG family [Streptomyces sp. NPDC006415]|uniref:ribbon-helix-helix protein, CopG family n=1 Tax=Streptomyces sp. NPDC006415 TaxID=3155351 RepID=UPI0033A05052
MKETSAHLPDDWEARLDAESSATGVSKAELVRRGIAMLLDSAERPKRSRELPVFDSGRSRAPDEMDDAVYEHIKERAAHR